MTRSISARGTRERGPLDPREGTGPERFCAPSPWLGNPAVRCFSACLGGVFPGRKTLTTLSKTGESTWPADPLGCLLELCVN